MTLHRGPWKPEETSDPSLENELREEHPKGGDMGDGLREMSVKPFERDSEWFYIPERESHTHDKDWRQDAQKVPVH